MRSSLCLGLYRDSKANTSPPPEDASTTDSIHRQYPRPGGVQGTSKEFMHRLLCTSCNVCVSILGPAQAIEFLGVTVDMVQMQWKLPVDKIKNIRVDSRAMMRQERRALLDWWGR